MKEPPIVIGGCGRSGTTLLHSILSSLPDVYAIPHETYAFVPNVWRRKGELDPPAREPITQAIEDVRALYRRWIEKTPKNVRNIGRVFQLYPTARFLHIVRDGRDVVTSMHPGKPGYHVSPRRWVEDVEAGLDYQHDPRVLTLRYEDLVTDFRSTLEQVCEHIGEVCGREILRYPRYATLTESGAWEHDARPPHAQSVGRWQAPEHEWRVEELLEDPRAEALLRRFGYVGAVDSERQ